MVRGGMTALMVVHGKCRAWLPQQRKPFVFCPRLLSGGGALAYTLDLFVLLATLSLTLSSLALWFGPCPLFPIPLSGSLSSVCSFSMTGSAFPRLSLCTFSGWPPLTPIFQLFPLAWWGYRSLSLVQTSLLNSRSVFPNSLEDIFM